MNPAISNPSLRCLGHTVPKAWLDRNGHMNMQHYFGLADRALAALETGVAAPDGTLLLPRFRPRRSRIQYRKELFAGQEVEVFLLPRSIQQSEATLDFHIITAGAAPAFSCECSVSGVFTDPLSGEPLPPDPIALDLLSRLTSPAPPISAPSPAFVLPFREDHWFTAAAGPVPAGAFNERGEVGLQGHTHLFEHGGMGMFAELNRAESVFIPGRIGGFALATTAEYLAPFRKGDRFRVRSRVCALGRKTCSFRHELFRAPADGGGEESLAASCDHTMVFIDMTQRRSTTVPDKFREIVSRRYGVEIPPA